MTATPPSLPPGLEIRQADNGLWYLWSDIQSTTLRPRILYPAFRTFEAAVEAAHRGVCPVAEWSHRYV